MAQLPLCSFNSYRCSREIQNNALLILTSAFFLPNPLLISSAFCNAAFKRNHFARWKVKLIAQLSNLGTVFCREAEQECYFKYWKTIVFQFIYMVVSLKSVCRVQFVFQYTSCVLLFKYNYFLCLLLVFSTALNFN